MPDVRLSELVPAAVESVLEQMFFASAEPACAEQWPAEPAVGARVDFRGLPSGWIGVCVSAGAARALTAAFLGEEEDGLEESRVAAAVCELANILCGSIVSGLESGSGFELEAPRPAPPASILKAAVRQEFRLEEGCLAVAVELID